MISPDFPTYLPQSPRVIVIGDAHGDLGRMVATLRAMEIINENLQWVAQPANTIVVQMGDQLDSLNRTDECEDWERTADTDLVVFMDRLDGLARLHGGRVISLIGNHELMNIMGEFMYVSPKSAQMNGGLESRRRQLAPNGYVAQILAKRCVLLKVGRVLFCHGGLLPQHLNIAADNIHVVNELFRKVVKRVPLGQDENRFATEMLLGPQGILWTRAYVEMAVLNQDVCAVVQEVLDRTDSDAICVGHNTVNSISHACGGRLWFTDAQFSRAYGRSPRVEVLQILDGTKFQVVSVSI
jgi:hypothetical protein